MNKSRGGTWTHLSVKHTWPEPVNYATGKELTLSQLPPFQKVKLNKENYAGRFMSFSVPNPFDRKIRCVAFKQYRFQGLTLDLLVQSQGVGPRNLYFKNVLPLGTSMSGLLKHNFEIMRRNSGNS